jgi:hypothetical protein
MLHKHGCSSPYPLPSILATVSSRLQYKSYSKLDGLLIQGVTSLFYCLNWPNRFGAPNAINWHTFLDLPAHTTILRTVRSTELPLFSPFTPLQKVFRKKLSIAHAIDVLFWILSSSSRRYDVSIDSFLESF